MVQITLVRHGQANTGAEDEASYDRLSPLGREQAAWLGAYLAQTGQQFDQIISGTLSRQIDTAAAIGAALDQPVTQDPRLNELDYFGLAGSLQDLHAIDMPTDRDSFIAHLPQVLTAWQNGAVHSHLETFTNFEARIQAVLTEAEAKGGRIMLVTSGGVIGMTMRLMLGLQTPSYANVCMAVRNTSLHRFVKDGGVMMLETFNATPHLDHADRSHARTHI